jgi:acyl-coenzyme A synthetase/AMP-(fatty) acid ligase
VSALLLDRILPWAERTPQAPALIGAAQTVNHRQLRALVSRAVTHLGKEGIRKGDVVGLGLAQTPLYPIVFLALGWIGALVVPVPPALRPQDREELLNRYGIGALISERFESVPAHCRLVQVQGVGASGHEDMAAAGAPGYGPDTPLRIGLTSGTTGMPKGVLQTHGSFIDRMDRMHCDLADIPRVIPPALHITLAINFAMHALCKGGAIVFPASYGNRQLLEAMGRHGVTHFALTPANLRLITQGFNVDAPAFPSLRQLRLVGSTPTRVVLDEARRKLTPNVYVPYGIGEIGLVSMATPQMLLDHPTTVGALEPGVRLEFVREGEIRMMIPGQAADYCGPDAGKGERFRDGWFHSGDRGRMSPEGLLFIEGRIDSLINLGGFKVSPEFVESVLMEFAGVRQAAVVPFDDGSGVTKLIAAIIRAGELDWQALRDYAMRRLELMAPARFVEVQELPRNALGKLERDQITEASLATAPARPA